MQSTITFQSCKRLISTMYKIRRSLSSGKDEITLINASNDCNNEIVKGILLLYLLIIWMEEISHVIVLHCRQ